MTTITIEIDDDDPASIEHLVSTIEHVLGLQSRSYIVRSLTETEEASD